jgi:ferric-dicitrate binding protein FerR (iron transport regulator)
MNSTTDDPRGDEDEAERALRSGLHASVLSPEALQRIRLATEAEWRANTQDRRSRRWGGLAAAASVVLVAGLGAFTLYLANAAPGAGAAMGTIARAESPGIVNRLLLRPDQSLRVGQSLHASQSLTALGDALVSLAAGGNLRVARGTGFEIESPNKVRLEHGEIYVDIPPGGRAADTFMITTAAGDFLHVGTQFALAVNDGETRLRVREGSVQWLGGNGEETVSAGTEVRIDRQQRVTRHALATSGDAWTWTENMVPDLEIEGRPLLEFLEWVGRETGRELVLVDEQVRDKVAQTRVHGDVRGMPALQALRAVMAATSMRFDLAGGAIRVSLASDAPTARN